MSQYRKLIAALIGVALMIANDRFGYNLTGMETELTGLVIAALTALGVWAAPNSNSKGTTLQSPSIVALLALALALSACAGTVGTRAANAVAISCDTYAVALEALTPYKPDLSASQVDRVDAANALVDPVCLPGSAIDPAEGAETVQAGIALLQTLKEGF